MIFRKMRKERCAYHNMMDRCYRKKHPQYHRYGGRGITVCDIWRKDISQFLYDVGPCPPSTNRTDEFQIDRIDNNKGYFPGNVKWSTRHEQMLNRENKTGQIYSPEDDIEMPILAWAEILGCSDTALYNRLKAGKPMSWVLRPINRRASN